MTNCRVCNFNIRSVRNKITELGVLLRSLDCPELVCLTETWCSYDEIQAVKIDQYCLIDSYCRTKQRGGGVALFARNDLSSIVKKTPIVGEDSNCEYVCAEVSLNLYKFYVSCFYRAPTANFTSFKDKIDLFISNLNKRDLPLIVCGDFNINFDPDVADSRARELCLIMNSYNLKSCISEYSRIQNESKTVIDNIFFNRLSEFVKSETVFNYLSDHALQLLSFPCMNPSKDGPTYYYKRNFVKEANIITFQNRIASESWNVISQGSSACEKFSLFFDHFKDIMEKCFPLELFVYTKNGCGKSWLCDDIVSQSNFLRFLYDYYKKTNNVSVLEQYRELLKEHRRLIVNTKRAYNEKIYNNSSNKSKATWRILSNEVSLKKQHDYPDTFFDESGNVIDNLEMAANTFNSFFFKFDRYDG